MRADGICIRHHIFAGPDHWSRVILVIRRKIENLATLPRCEEHIVEMSADTLEAMWVTHREHLSEADAIFCTMGVGAPSKVCNLAASQPQSQPHTPHTISTHTTVPYSPFLCKPHCRHHQSPRLKPKGDCCCPRKRRLHTTCRFCPWSQSSGKSRAFLAVNCLSIFFLMCASNHGNLAFNVMSVSARFA